MNAAVSFQDKYERTWIDEFGPYVFAQVARISDSSEVKKTNARKIDAVKHQVNKFKFAYTILDTSEVEEPSAAAFAEYCNSRLADQIKAGVEYVAFLTPKNRQAANALNEALKSLSFKSMIGVHESFERALHYTNQLWSYRLTHPVR